MATALDELLEDDLRRQRLRASAREQSRHFDSADMSRRNLELWEGLATRRRASSDS
jgi:glycosyltransferase involved in cell wall biosynthesis